jgi:capsular polysaccharide biosynthesis protein
MNNDQTETLNLKSFFALLWDQKKFILSFSAGFTFLTILYVLLVTPIYESTSIVIHNSDQNSPPQMSSAMQQVASIVSADSSVSTEQKIAISRVLSKDYFQRIYSHNILLECLISEELFCLERLPDLSAPMQGDKESKFTKPSFMNAYREYRRKFVIYNNFEIITFSFKHESPIVAFNFLSWIIKDANEYIKNIDVNKALNSMEFLEASLYQSRNLELQKLISALVQQEIQTIALSKRSENFAFDIIDPPYIPEERVFPKRTFSVLISGFLSLFLAISLVVILNYFNSSPVRVWRSFTSLIGKN